MPVKTGSDLSKSSIFVCHSLCQHNHEYRSHKTPQKQMLQNNQSLFVENFQYEKCDLIFSYKFARPAKKLSIILPLNSTCLF